MVVPKTTTGIARREAVHPGGMPESLRSQSHYEFTGVKPGHVSIPMHNSPSGATDNSPRFQSWVSHSKSTSPVGTADAAHVPANLPQPGRLLRTYPRLARNPNPEGWKKVAGGRSERPPERRLAKGAHPGGMPAIPGPQSRHEFSETGHVSIPAHIRKRWSGIPPGCDPPLTRFTGGRSLGCLGTTTGYRLPSLRDATPLLRFATKRHGNSLAAWVRHTTACITIGSVPRRNAVRSSGQAGALIFTSTSVARCADWLACR